MWTPNTCLRLPASSFPRLRKAGPGPGNEATHPLHSVQYGRLGTRLVSCGHARLARDYHLTGQALLCTFDEVSQLLHEIGHLLYEAGRCWSASSC